MAKIILLLTMLLQPAFAFGANDIFDGSVKISSAFYNGNDFLKLKEVEQINYVMGLLDGYAGATMFGADEKYLKWVEQCVEDKNGSEINSIYVSFLEKNPNSRSLETQYSLFTALRKVCVPKNGSKKALN